MCLMLVHCFLRLLVFLGEPGEPQEEMHSIYSSKQPHITQPG